MKLSVDSVVVLVVELGEFSTWRRRYSDGGRNIEMVGSLNRPPTVLTVILIQIPSRAIKIKLPILVRLMTLTQVR